MIVVFYLNNHCVCCFTIHNNIVFSFFFILLTLFNTNAIIIIIRWRLIHLWKCLISCPKPYQNNLLPNVLNTDSGVNWVHIRDDRTGFRLTGQKNGFDFGDVLSGIFSNQVFSQTIKWLSDPWTRKTATPPVRPQNRVLKYCCYLFIHTNGLYPPLKTGDYNPWTILTYFNANHCQLVGSTMIHIKSTYETAFNHSST